MDVTLADSGLKDAATGDGVYTGTFTPSGAGDYIAVVKFSGTSGSGAYSRKAVTTFRVETPKASLVSFQETTPDDDEDGRADRLVIATNVTVQTAGEYQADITLTASNGETLNARARRPWEQEGVKSGRGWQSPDRPNDEGSPAGIQAPT